MPWPDGPSRYSLRACCGSYRGDLRAIELGHYLIARSVGDELALVENHDPADQAQERGALGYDEEGSALQFRAEPVEKPAFRSEEPASELQSLMRLSYAVFCLTNTRHK